MKKYNVAIMGATGAVGACFLRILEERKFPVKNLRLLASPRSKGKKLKFNGKLYPVEVLTHDSFKDIDIVLASAGASRSLEFLPSAVKAGAVCVDNSSAFRMDKDVPLVVPEVNPEMIKENKGIIANPNCSTIQMVVALWPIHKAAVIKRIVVTTFQSVSGAGQKKIIELWEQSKAFTSGRAHFPAETGSRQRRENMPYSSRKIVPVEFLHPIAFNLIPQIDVFLENAYTKEEMKMMNETQKIMGDPSIQVNATCVRVPIFYAHSESVNIETEKPISPDDVRKLLSKAEGVTVIDDPENKSYPMPIFAEGKDDIFVGRIRKDESIKNGISMWIVADNIRKGAALNAIQIAELL
ncbi:MAG: aspartate-semialdehyde dehydrogenase [Candidatus Omnitrophota bacterium]|nr:aspartate-semialdehyde dehydrogenase [Candidatus Omnitrophota bacterium]